MLLLHSSPRRKDNPKAENRFFMIFRPPTTNLCPRPLRLQLTTHNLELFLCSSGPQSATPDLDLSKPRSRVKPGMTAIDCFVGTDGRAAELPISVRSKFTCNMQLTTWNCSFALPTTDLLPATPVFLFSYFLPSSAGMEVALFYLL